MLRKHKHFMKFTFVIIFLSIISLSAYSSDQVVWNFLKGQTTKIKEPFKLRDPFKQKKAISIIKNKKEKKSGVFSNIPSIENVPISNIRIIGVLLGRDRRAIAKISGGGGALGPGSFILKEGMFLGENEAEIKAILPGGVVVVEKFKNVYDQDEYLETILPVSPDQLGQE